MLIPKNNWLISLVAQVEPQFKVGDKALYLPYAPYADYYPVEVTEVHPEDQTYVVKLLEGGDTEQRGPHPSYFPAGRSILIHFADVGTRLVPFKSKDQLIEQLEKELALNKSHLSPGLDQVRKDRLNLNIKRTEERLQRLKSGEV